MCLTTMGTGEPQALHVKRLSQWKTKRRRWLSRTEIYEPRPMDEDGENLQKNIKEWLTYVLNDNGNW